MSKHLRRATTEKGKGAKSRILNARVSEELRTKIERYASHHDMPVSHVMLKAVETLLAEDSVGRGQPLLQTAKIPNRLLETERHFGLSVLESVESLKDFGVNSVHDFVTLGQLLQGLNATKLKVFAETYEVSLDWLLTGEGPLYKPTHRIWSLLEAARRIQRLWLEKQLSVVWFVANKSSLNLNEPARIQLILEKPHPKLGGFKVYESFPTVSWRKQHQDILHLIGFCWELFQATNDPAVHPCGRTLKPHAQEGLEEGWWCVPQAFSESTLPWHPKKTLNELHEMVFPQGIVGTDDWQTLTTLTSELVANSKRK
jgi:hypothetical protein